MLNGVLVVDKPAGPTSHDIVERVRNLFGTRAGHTGTLDPFATGVLPICLGKATRLSRFLADGDKVYRATVRLGFATTTDDLLGEPQGDPRPVAVSAPAVAEAARSLTGPIDQVPPSYSAKRVGGRRLYELAREGFAPLPGAVRVTVHAFDVIGVEADRVEIEVCCSPGTYVRALARDLGQALGVGAHLLALRRLRTGSFGLEHAVDGNALTAEHRERVLPLAHLLTDLPAVHVSALGRSALRHGRDLDRSLVVSEFPDRPVPRWRVLDETGDLLALAVPRGFGQEASALPSRPVLHPDLVLVD